MIAKYLEIPVNTVVASGTSEFITGTTASAALASGTNAAAVPNELNDATADFVTDGIVAGDIAYNITAGTQGAITVVAATKLTFATNLFNAGSESYAVRKEKQLNAVGTTFTARGVKVGDIVKNVTAGTQTTVAALINETSLTLTADIFNSPTLFNDNFTIEAPADELYDFGQTFVATVSLGDVMENTTANTSEKVIQIINNNRLKLSGNFGTTTDAYSIFDSTFASTYLIDMNSIVFVDRHDNEQTKIILNTNVTPTLTIDHSDQGSGRAVAVAIQNAMKRGYIGVNMPDPPGPSASRVQMPIFEGSVITVESLTLS